MSAWVPEQFARLVEAARRGGRPRVAVRALVGWFGFTRRGAQVNEYVRAAMREAAISCNPPFEKAFPDDELTFATVAPVVVVSAAPPAPAREPPHPVAIFDAILDAQALRTRRVSSRLDAIERLVALLVFALVAVHRSAAGAEDALRQALEPHLPKPGGLGPPVSFGSWVELARRLAALRRDVDDPLLTAARSVFARASKGESLGDTLASKVVPLRNRHHHASNLPDAAWDEAESLLVDVTAALRGELAPLLDAEFVSVHRTAVGDRAAYRYTLRILHGGGPFFRTKELETDARIVPGWAHLLREGRAPLRLAPGVYCHEDAATEQVDVFFCRTLALDPGQRVGLLALVGGAERRESLPP